MASRDGERFDRGFFEREAVTVAIELLGATVCRCCEEGLTSGRIVEVEAYGDATDLASHAARRTLGQAAAMTGRAGIAYVYRSYGTHAMFNVVARPPGGTGAVLVRALEPMAGIDVMRSRRGVDEMRALCSGPGKLCQAMAIGFDLHGADVVTGEELWLEPGERPTTIKAGERIGISRSTELPWRFFDGESTHISGHRRGTMYSGDASERPHEIIEG